MYDDVIIDVLKLSIFYYEFRGIMGSVITVLGPLSTAIHNLIVSSTRREYN